MGKLRFIYLDRKKIILYQEELVKGKKEIIKKEEKEIVRFPLTRESWEEVIGKNNSVYLILSPALIVFRELSLPFGGERKIKRTIKYTLESSLPFSAEEFEVFYTKRKERDSFHLDAYVFTPLLLKTIESLEEFAALQGIYLLPHVLYSYLATKMKLPPNALLWIRHEENFLYLCIRDGKAGKAGEIPWREKELKLYLFSQSPAEHSLPIYFWGEKEEWFDKLLSREEISVRETFTPSSSTLPLILPRSRYAPNLYTFNPASTFSWKFTLALLVLLLLFSSSRLIWEKYWLENRIIATKSEMKEIYLSLFPNSRVIDPLLQLKSKIKEKGGKSSSSLLELLREISLKYPGKGVSIEKIIFSGEVISLEGTIPSYATLDHFVGELDKSPLFGAWEIVNAESKKEGRVRFRIRSKLK